MTTLHYFYDPLCGWCYGAAPLLAMMRDIDSLNVRLHGGGMMSHQNISPDFRRFVMPHDARIEQLTGQPFGQNYFDGLLLNTHAVLDSTPPIAAVLAAIDCGTDGCDMLSVLQRAHYVEGLEISQRDTLLSLADKIGLESTQFEQALIQQLSGSVNKHIQASRKQLAENGGRGFPTFLLEQEAAFTLLDASNYYGQPEQWKTHVLSSVQLGLG